MIGKSRKLRKINFVRLNVNFQGKTLLLEMDVLKATLYLFYFQANIDRFEKNAGHVSKKMLENRSPRVSKGGDG